MSLILKTTDFLAKIILNKLIKMDLKIIYKELENRGWNVNEIGDLYQILIHEVADITKKEIIKKDDSILKEVKVERLSQNKKWGEQNHNVIEWLGILMEEVGEVSKEAVDFYFKNELSLKAGEDSIKDLEIQAERLKRYRKELIQVAAVAVQMIECLDRNNG